MAWTPKQIRVFHTAATAAGWNERQRYIAMRHAGCPLQGAGAERRPSAKHPHNNNAAFERVMALAESAAAVKGRSIRGPGNAQSWNEAVRDQRGRMIMKAKDIAFEAIDRMPSKFDQDLLEYIIEHTTQHDKLGEFTPDNLIECDAGQLYRVIESLRAFVGRIFHKAGIVPRSFEIPASAKRRVQREQQTGQQANQETALSA